MTCGGSSDLMSAAKGSILEPHSRTEPASVRVVPLNSGCAPTGPTLAALSERTCRARHSSVHRSSKFSRSRWTPFPRANWAVRHHEGALDGWPSMR